MAKITLGITGSVAVVKIPPLVSALQALNHEVFIVMTKHATVFEHTTEIRALVDDEHFFTHEISRESETAITHIELAQAVDLIAVIPATFNSINKYALGIADDLLSSIVAARTVPLLLAPAMNTHMFENSTLQQSLNTLSLNNTHIVPPAHGMLACGVEGIGRLAATETIIKHISQVITPSQPLQGKNVLISAGPTRVYIDPIRYISNTSSGQMGYALAQAAVQLGARVTLVIGPNKLTLSNTVSVIPVETPDEMLQAMQAHYPVADYVFMTAAVSDYRPKKIATTKIKKTDAPLSIELERSPDILATLGQSKMQQVLIGFAAEDENHLANGQAKLQRKNLDYIIVNDLANFNSTTNQVTLLSRDGTQLQFDKQDKTALAQELLSAIVQYQNCKK